MLLNHQQIKELLKSVTTLPFNIKEKKGEKGEIIFTNIENPEVNNTNGYYCNVRRFNDKFKIIDLDLSGFRGAKPNIRNIDFFEHNTQFSDLEKLDISENKIENIELLSNLAYLEMLDAEDNRISNISVLTNLRKLRLINLSFNKVTEISLKFIESFADLKILSLFGNPIKNIPTEIFGTNWVHNCLQSLKTYFQDGETYGWNENKDLKLVLIGNGGVGKTSLVRRLVENKFDKEYDSTHGIQLEQYTDLQPYHINIWDFGGQDIYHATHRLFMKTRALFVLVWDWQTEQEPTQKIKENNRANEYQNHDLYYWLNYVQVLGKGSKVIVVQTKVQRDGEKKHPKENELRAKYKDIWLDTISIESEENNWAKNGFKKLKLSIENAIESGEVVRKEKLPKNWITQRKEFYKLLKSDTKTIDYEYFVNEMCKDNPISPDTILSWLSDSGVVFYQKGLFENKIIINQQWIIDAIYTLFDREKHYYRLKDAKGRFTKDDLNEFWENNHPAEQRLFLSFMLSCEICYYSDYVKDEYIAPAFLPDKKEGESLVDFWEGKTFDTEKYEFAFLHYGIIQSFIVQLNNFCSESISIESVWQYGILFKYKNLYASVEANLQDKTILVNVNQSNDQSLLNKIKNLIYELDSKENIKRTFLSVSNVQRREDKKDRFDILLKEVREIRETQKEHLGVSKDTNEKVTIILNELRSEFQKIQERDILLDEKLELQHKAIFNFLKDKNLLESEKSIQQELSQRLIPNKIICLDSMTLKYLASAEYVWQNSSQNLDFSIAISEFGKAVENEMFALMETFKLATASNPPYTRDFENLKLEFPINASKLQKVLEAINSNARSCIAAKAITLYPQSGHNPSVGLWDYHNSVPNPKPNLDNIQIDFENNFNLFVRNHFEGNFRNDLKVTILNPTLESLMPSHCITRKYLDFIREVRNSAAHPSNHIRIKPEAENYRKLVLDFFGFWCNHLK